MHVYTWLAHLDIRIDQNTPFFNKRLKKLAPSPPPPQTPPLVERGTPPPHTHLPRRLWRLDPRACGARPRRLVPPPPAPNVMSGSATGDVSVRSSCDYACTSVLTPPSVDSVTIWVGALYTPVRVGFFGASPICRLSAYPGMQPPLKSRGDQGFMFKSRQAHNPSPNPHPNPNPSRKLIRVN